MYGIISQILNTLSQICSLTVAKEWISLPLGKKSLLNSFYVIHECSSEDWDCTLCIQPAKALMCLSTIFHRLA